MKKIERIRGSVLFSAFLVAFSLFGVLIPYSLILGWNLITGFFFWFILVPLISIFSSRFYEQIDKSWITGIVGCIIFYLVVVFLVYSHYQTDFFKLMMISSLSSILMIWLLERTVFRKNQALEQ